MPADPVVTPCSVQLDLFLDPLLEEPPTPSRTDPETWRAYTRLQERAGAACASCPLMVDCLYKAVVQTDISGYVGGTTPKERRRIRRLLGVQVEAEDFDAASGARGTRRPVDHDDVLRARAAYPNDSMDMLATRLGCSLSTVKRHLRKARTGSGPKARPQAEPPAVQEVVDAWEEVVGHRRTRSA
jgi:hypothetical protein